MAKFLFLDTETTGVDPQKNGIVQLAAILEINGVEAERFETLIKPWEGCIIEDAALEVSGITREQIQNAPDEREAWRKFTMFLGRHIDKFSKTDKSFLIGYNVNFDDNFMRALADRVGDRYLGSWKWADCIDVRGMAALKLCEIRHTLPNFKLGTIAEVILGEQQFAQILDEGGLHNAMTDIVLTREVFHRIK